MTEAHEIIGIYKLFLLSLLRRVGLPRDLCLAKLGRTWRDGGAPSAGASERRMHRGREGRGGGGEAWMDAMGVITWEKTKKTL